MIITKDKYVEILEIQGIGYNKKSKWFTTSLERINVAINYTHCCTELCDEERCSYTLNNNSKMCDDCGKVFD